MAMHMVHAASRHAWRVLRTLAPIPRVTARILDARSYEMQHEWSNWQTIRLDTGDGKQKALLRRCLRRHRDPRGRMLKCPAMQRKHASETPARK